MLDKKNFYKELKYFAGKKIDMNFYVNIDPCYQLIFSWWKIPIKEGDKISFEWRKEMIFNLIDRSKQGSKKNIKELHFDYENSKITSDYRLYLFAKKFVNEEISKYERIIA